MYVVRNTFTCKPGKVKELVSRFKAAEHNEGSKERNDHPLDEHTGRLFGHLIDDKKGTVLDRRLSDLKNLLDRSRSFAAEFEIGPSFPPSLTTIVLTCADARVDPAHVLGLGLGEAFVLRNAGGRVTDDLELDVAILWTLAAEASGDEFHGLSLAIVQHTECGFRRLTDPDFAAAVSERLGLAQSRLEGLAVADPLQSLERDIATLSRSPLVPKQLIVSGHLYHVENGETEQLIEPVALASL